MGSWFSKASACSIDNLADEHCSNIFKHLPPHQRIHISLVCQRWHRIVRLPWFDIVDLELTSIPAENLGAIIKLCPNLQSVSASSKTFSFRELIILLRLRLSSLKLYSCSSEFRLKQSALPSLFSEVLFGSLPNARWEELVLHDFDVCAHLDGFRSEEFNVEGALPLTLKRLQLSGIKPTWRRPLPFNFRPARDRILGGLGRLTNLTCLILASAPGQFWFLDDPLSDIFLQLRTLQHLRELCVACPEYSFRYDAVACLPKLEVLFLANMSFHKQNDLTQLATKHPTLRILVILGNFPQDCTVPSRRLYPNGFGADPLPLLHVFLGRQAFANIHFADPTSDAIKIHPITTTFPEFLEREEIAPIFDGVWIAAQIKEGAKRGVFLWKYLRDIVCLN